MLVRSLCMPYITIHNKFKQIKYYVFFSALLLHYTYECEWYYGHDNEVHMWDSIKQPLNNYNSIKNH